MSIVSNNIKYLRRLNGLTQEQFARKIQIKRSLLGAYEEARANPNLTNLKNMAAAFGISVDNLLKNDLRKIRETPDLSLPMNATRPMTVSHSGSVPPAQRVPSLSEPQPLSKVLEQFQQPEPEIRTVGRQISLKPVTGEVYAPQNPAPAPSPYSAQIPQPGLAQPGLAQPGLSQPGFAPSVAPSVQQAPMNHQAPQAFPTFNNQAPGNAVAEVNSGQYPSIQWVSRSRQTEYLSHFQHPGFLAQLPYFQLPNLPSGYYRAFESGDDFPFPGALLVGTFIRNWYDILDGKQYVFLLRNLGLVYRTAFNQVKTTGQLTLTSILPSVPNHTVPLHDVLEVWEVKAFVSTQMPDPTPSLGRIGQLVDELQNELSQLGR